MNHGGRIALRMVCLACAWAAIWPQAVAGRVSATRLTSDVSVKAVVLAARAYVIEYQRAVQAVLADEISSQRVVVAGRDVRRRTTRGELFLTYLGADKRWVAVHDVADVDGALVTDREDLQALLAASPVRSVARRLFERNARFNIGRVTRNFNEPTFALQLLDPEREAAVAFDRSKMAIDAATSALGVVAIDAREREPPTLVSGPGGGAVYGRGTLVVDPATGRIVRATVSIKDGPVTAELDTTFAFEPTLSLWVPSVFTERYRYRDRRVDEVTECESRYTNYRRFDVTARIR